MQSSPRNFWTIVLVIVIVLIAAVLLYFYSSSTQQPSASSETSETTTQNIQATFTCDGGKSVQATFMNSTTSTTTGNSVQLSLSDGRQMTLPQVISADGARYANADQSFVFWNVGNQATIWGNSTTTFTNCISSNS